MKTILLRRLAVVLMITSIVQITYAQVTISVDASKIIRKLNGYEHGINTNYLMDGTILGSTSTTSTTNALKAMGIKLLRYPGGEKSDNYLWSKSPYTAASPRMAIVDTFGWPTKDPKFVDTASTEKVCKSAVLDFDEFTALYKNIGAKPLIVVAYDAMYLLNKGVPVKGRPTKKQLIANAVSWVRYANKTKKLGIKFWMIGNESWNDPSYNGRVTPQQYASDLVEFASAMKAVDSSIKIIANGKASWWPVLLKSSAAKWIDVLAFSEYPTFGYTGGYAYYRTNTVNLAVEAKAAVSAIDLYATKTDSARITVMPVEYNSIDWSGKWSYKNNLGHALCNFQMFGDLISIPKVEGACLWNTRWITNATAPRQIYDALTSSGSLNATGTALKIWGENLLNTLVYSKSSDSRVKVYTSYSSSSKKMHILILNKDTVTKTIALKLNHYLSNYTVTRKLFYGTSVNDTSPKYVSSTGINLSKFSAPKTSITVITLTPTSTLSSNELAGSVVNPNNTNDSSDFNVTISPNPIIQDVIIKTNSDVDRKVNIDIIDISGRVVYKQTVQISKGSSETVLPATALAKGFYILRIYNKAIRFIK